MSTDPENWYPLHDSEDIDFTKIMTPTPRTDAVPPLNITCLSSLARQLECELEEAKADLKEQLETYNDQQSQLEQARRELMDLRNPVICQGCGHAVPIIHRTTPLGTDPANWRCDICIQWTVEKDLLHAQLTAHKAALEKAREAFCQTNPWSILAVLAKLSEAADILLIEKDYDGHGWESIQHAQQAYRNAIPSIAEALTTINAALEEK